MNWRYVAILVYTCFVHDNSLTPASISSQESGFLLEKVRGAMGSLSWEHLWLTEHIIGKAVHFAEYVVLDGLTARIYGSYGRHRICNRDVLMLIFMTPLIDEVIQIFIAGRSGQINDVWPDTSGIAVGVAVIAGVMCCLRKGRTVE